MEQMATQSVPPLEPYTGSSIAGKLVLGHGGLDTMWYPYVLGHFGLLYTSFKNGGPELTNLDSQKFRIREFWVPGNPDSWEFSFPGKGSGKIDFHSSTEQSGDSASAQ